MTMMHWLKWTPPEELRQTTYGVSPVAAVVQTVLTVVESVVTVWQRQRRLQATGAGAKAVRLQRRRHLRL